MQKSQPLYHINLFSEYPTISHAVSSVPFGTMKKSDGELHHANLIKFVRAANIKGQVIGMRQIHSANVSVVENTRELRIPDVDALVTNKKDLALTVLTADCLPIFLFDPKHQVIGIVHAGSKGLLRGVIENTVHTFVTMFNSDPKDILAGIGPGIETSCYEVGHEYAKTYQEAYPDFNGFIAEKDGKAFLDLRAMATQLLQKEGILDMHIEVTNICTKCDTNFYSYRRGDKDDRFASIIRLR